ncbi:MAG: 23S rRNA (adenine(2503)-C(2))-methyltransferase RlmN [Bacteriovoracaceae bacterium]
MNSLYDYSLNELTEQFKSEGFQAFNAKQVFNWLYKHYGTPLNEWTNVSKKMKAYIQENFQDYLPTIVWHGLSKDGTRKFLVKMHDSQTVECVVIPAKNKRLTLCVSSQIGCAIGCRFCHTGTMGLKRHLKTSEIVGQLLVVGDWLRENVNDDEKITNMVYMGQGEPLHNFDNIKRATEIFLDPQGLGYGQRRITLSTSGLVPQIEKMLDFPPINIAISLHAAHNDIRSELMPINKAYDLQRLFGAIKKLPLKAHRRITYEYLLIKGLNDRQIDIDALCELINRDESKINLIPFNEYPESSFKRPSQQTIKWFNDSLNERGFISTVRVTMGTDILAACGQLKSEYEKVNLWNKMSRNFELIQNQGR